MNSWARNYERTSNPTSNVYKETYNLRKKDVVFGRGRKFQKHPGNERMSRIIISYKQHYISLDATGKMCLIEHIYKQITNDGARFLKRIKGDAGWLKVEKSLCLRKIRGAMRYRTSLDKQIGLTLSYS